MTARQADLTLEDLRAMEPFEFEHFVADVWRGQGFRAEVLQRARDGGVDVIAERGDERLAIQAKRFGVGNRVGPARVREMAGIARRPEFTGAVIVTTSDFTRASFREANEHDVRLVPGEELLRLHEAGRLERQPNPGRERDGLLIRLLRIAINDPERVFQAIINVFILLVMLAVFYAVIDSIATNMYGFPLPWGV